MFGNYFNTEVSFERVSDTELKVFYTDYYGNKYSGSIVRQPTEIEKLKAQIASLEAKLGTDQFIEADVDPIQNINLDEDLDDEV